MTHRTDYFFLHIKDIYHNFPRPSKIEEEIWDEVLTPYNAEEMKSAIKSYRKSGDGAFPPIPSKFAPHLRTIKKYKKKTEPLPFSPEHYYMQEDIKNYRCKYLYPVYVDAVKYILTEMLQHYVSKDKLKKLTHEEKYNLAMEYGLFEYFHIILDMVAKKRGEQNA